MGTDKPCQLMTNDKFNKLAGEYVNSQESLLQTCLAFSEMLNASCAVADAFWASLLALAKHFKPSSISVEVLFNSANTCFPDM